MFSLDKAEWLEDIRKGSCSLKSFLGAAGEGIDERESEEGKVKRIGPLVKYLRGVSDAGTRLLNSVNEELGRHRAVMQSVRVLIMCCGIVLVPSCWS